MLQTLGNCVLSPFRISITWWSHLVQKSQQYGPTALFSFALVKRDAPAEHVYTFIITASLFCIMSTNKTIHLDFCPRATTKLSLSS